MQESIPVDIVSIEDFVAPGHRQDGAGAQAGGEGGARSPSAKLKQARTGARSPSKRSQGAGAAAAQVEAPEELIQKTEPKPEPKVDKQPDPEPLEQ